MLLEESVTGLGNWRRCRRKYDLEAFNRQRLIRIDTVPTSFSIGTAIHLALAAHAAGLEPREIVQDYLLKREAEVLKRPETGGYANTELVKLLLDSRNEVIDIVTHYYTYWGWSNPLEKNGLRYIAVEIPVRAPVPGMPDCYLVGTIDGIAVDEEDNFWLVDHKTYSHKPQSEFMDVNDQFTGYTWLFRELFGYMPMGIIYDGIAKKLPSIPKLLKNRTMSQQWIDTTAAVYLEALLEAGLNPLDYGDILNRLADRDQKDQNPFFTRWKVHIPRKSVDSYGAYLKQQFYEIKMVKEIELSIPDADKEEWLFTYLYPNYDWRGCYECRVRDLCRAIQFKEDIAYILENFYRRSEGHETYKALKINPGDIKSPYELVSHVPNILVAEGYIV